MGVSIKEVFFLVFKVFIFSLFGIICGMALFQIRKLLHFLIQQMSLHCRERELVCVFIFFRWTLELFVKTSGLTLWVIVAVVSLLLVNAVVIFYFRWREKVRVEIEVRC